MYACACVLACARACMCVSVKGAHLWEEKEAFRKNSVCDNERSVERSSRGSWWFNWSFIPIHYLAYCGYSLRRKAQQATKIRYRTLQESVSYGESLPHNIVVIIVVWSTLASLSRTGLRSRALSGTRRGDKKRIVIKFTVTTARLSPVMKSSYVIMIHMLFTVCL